MIPMCVRLSRMRVLVGMQVIMAVIMALIMTVTVTVTMIVTVIMTMLMLMFIQVVLVGFLGIFVARQFVGAMALADRRQIQYDEREERGDYHPGDPFARGVLTVIPGHRGPLRDSAGTVEMRSPSDVTWTCVPAEAAWRIFFFF